MAGPTGVVLNEGSGGATCGVDSDGTYDYQIVKIGYSVSGSTPTQVSASNPLPSNLYASGTAVALGQTTMSASLPVALASNQSAIPSAQSGSWTVTADAGSGTFSVSGQLADGTTFTRGTTVTTPVAGAVSTAAPSLTTGDAATLSLNTSGGLRVDGSGVTQPVSGTFWQSTQPVSLASLPSLASGSNVIGGVTQSGTWDVTVNAALPSGTNTIGGTQPSVGSGGGASTYNVIAPATPAAVEVQSGAGKVWTIQAMNIGSSVAYLKVFDTASAPTLGTTNATWNIPIPANSSGAGFVISYPVGRKVSNNLYVAVTGGIAANDDTSISGSTVIIDMTYSA